MNSFDQIIVRILNACFFIVV